MNPDDRTVFIVAARTPEQIQAQREHDKARWLAKKGKTCYKELVAAIAADRWPPNQNVCVEWPHSKDTHGYGQVHHDDDVWKVHRVAYCLAVGVDLATIRTSSVLHSCGNRGCYRPSHLELGVRIDGQVGRVLGRGTNNSKKTECPKGHPYDAENTAYSKTGHRRCRACCRVRDRARRAGRAGRAPVAWGAGKQAQPRLPWAPFGLFLERSGQTNLTELYDRVGVAPETINGWRANGYIRMYRADHIAVKLGMHPSQIWADWYELTDLEALGLHSVK